MKIQTTIAVQHSLQNKPTAILSSIIEGVIDNVVWSQDFTRFGVNYRYISTSTGNVVEAKGWEKDVSEIETLYQMFKNDIPQGLTWAETNQWLVMQGFRFELAETFGLDFNQTEIVTE